MEYLLSNLQRFATHDGPGIRTVLFFKGCSLHCPWCANPETWHSQPELFFDPERCVGCGRCAKACSDQAIRIEKGKAVLNRKDCTGCGACAKACLNEALELCGRFWSLKEILTEIGKDDAYYQASGGGITLSGGEALNQDVLPLLQALKARGYRVALETEGAYSLERLEQALPYLDLVFHDVKHCDPAKLKRVTGADLTEIESHLQLLKQSNVQTIIRIPVIPGFNQDDLPKLLDYVKSLGFEEIQLLPFHRLGISKWKKLGRSCRYEKTPMMDKNSLKPYAEAKIQIGG